jgi:RNA polymerase-binding transcription factor DksA
MNESEVDGSVKRNRGGQLGNHNAFKHGFYSELYKRTEKEKLSQLQNADLTGEIELLRIQLNRYLESESTQDQLDYETRLQALRTVSLAVECLNRMIRTQAILNPELLKTNEIDFVEDSS